MMAQSVRRVGSIWLLGRSGLRNPTSVLNYLDPPGFPDDQDHQAKLGDGRPDSRKQLRVDGKFWKRHGHLSGGAVRLAQQRREERLSNPVSRLRRRIRALRLTDLQT